MKWIKLKKGNDWNVTYYAINPLTSTGYADARRGLQVVDGETVDVRWTDGAISTHKVRTREVSSSYNDMGHTYESWSTMIYVVDHLHGVDHLVPINEVEIDHAWAVSHGAK